MLSPSNLIRNLFPWFVKYYNRLEIRGLENLPRSGSAIIARNHSGGFDYDNFSLMSLFETLPRAHIHNRKVWLLYDDRSVISHNIWTKWVRLFTPIPVSLTNGGIPWKLLDKVIEKGDWLAIMPEGHSAATYEGYRLWKFFPGVIKLHMRYKIPIIPTANIGFIHAMRKIAQIYHPNKVPSFSHQIYLPLCFPTKLIVDFGKPMFFSEYYGKSLSKNQYFHLAAKVRLAVRKQIQNYIPGADWNFPYGVLEKKK